MLLIYGYLRVKVKNNKSEVGTMKVSQLDKVFFKQNFRKGFRKSVINRYKI